MVFEYRVTGNVAYGKTIDPGQTKVYNKQKAVDGNVGTYTDIGIGVLQNEWTLHFNAPYSISSITVLLATQNEGQDDKKYM